MPQLSFAALEWPAALTTPLDLDTLRQWLEIAWAICGIFLVFSLVGALLLQAAHEVLRRFVNKFIVVDWLGRRNTPLELSAFLDETHSSANSMFSLPYWQLTGQVGTALGAQLNLYPASRLVSALANLDSNYETQIKAQLARRGVEEKLEVAILRDVAARAQAGVNALHAHLRDRWNIFDYAMGAVAIILVTAAMTVHQTPPGQRRVLYTISVFAWLATPLVRRILERLVPFR